MKHERQPRWVHRLEKVCAVGGALVPVALVVGNVGFEGVIALVGVCWIARCIVSRQNPLPDLIRHPLTLPWVIWYTSILISLIVNGPGSKGWAHDVVFIRYVLFSLALLDVSRRLPVGRYLIIGLAAGVLYAAINTVSAYTFGFDLLGKPLSQYASKLRVAARISGLAAYAAPFFMLWAMAGKDLKKRYRALVFLIAVIAFAQLLQTHVRTAVLAGAAGGIWGILFVFRRRISPAIAWAAAGLIVLGVFLFFQLGGYWNLASIYDRIYFWKVAWNMWLAHPWLGVGISSFQDAYKIMADSGKVAAFHAPTGVVFDQDSVCHAHNLALQILSCTGLLGLAAFAWLFINATRMCFADRFSMGVGLVSWPLVVIVFGLTGFNIYDSWYLALLTLSLALIGSLRPGWSDSFETGFDRLS
jgi:O-antigen ligase